MSLRRSVHFRDLLPSPVAGDRPAERTPTPEAGEQVARAGAVADNLPAVVLVRDSKDRDGGVLQFNPQTWRSFVDLAKQIGPLG
nr:DUF397 domain-containing protein [Micromonospora sp. D93]